MGLPQIIMLILQSNQEAVVTTHPSPQPQKTQIPIVLPLSVLSVPLHDSETEENASLPLSWGQSGTLLSKEQSAQNSDRHSSLVIHEAQFDIAPGSSVPFRQSWQVWWLVSPGINSVSP